MQSESSCLPRDNTAALQCRVKVAVYLVTALLDCYEVFIEVSIDSLKVQDQTSVALLKGHVELTPVRLLQQIRSPAAWLLNLGLSAFDQLFANIIISLNTATQSFINSQDSNNDLDLVVMH